MTHLLKPAFLAWAWFVSICAYAQDEGHLRFLKNRYEYRVNTDATYTATAEVSYVLLTEAARIANGKVAINYNSKLEAVEVIDAYTLKADGRRIDVGPSGMQAQQGLLATGYGISQADQRKLMITFPRLDVGDAAVYRYRLTGKTPIFPGHFYVSHAYSRETAWEEVEISIDMPSSMALRTEAVKLDALPVQERNGRRTYRWRARNLPVVHNEPASVDVSPSTPHLIATTFKGWHELAAAYDKHSRPKSTVTPALRRMADKITGSATEPREQARIIYDWVAKNVRYVASWAGTGGWVPHTAESVLNNRYGDCKDHAVLMEALLAAKGIASTTVMINRDKLTYSLPSVAFPAFNHVITYVPALRLYLDSTNGSTTPFGMLPITDIGKPVIHTSRFDGVRHTPMLQPSEMTSLRLTRMKLSNDGAMRGELSIHATGPATVELRDLQRAIGQRKEAEWVEDLLAGQVLEGEGHVAFEDSTDGSAMTLRMNVGIKDFLSVTDNGTIPLAPLVAGPISFGSLRSIYKRPARAMPYWCPAYTLEDRYEIHLPENFRLTLPRGTSVSEASFSYRSSYELRHDVLNVTRRLAIKRAAMACQPSEYAAAKAVVQQIERDLREQVIYHFDQPRSP